MGGEDRDTLGIRLAGVNQTLKQVDEGLEQVESDMERRFDEASDERQAIREEMNREFDRTEQVFRRGLLAFFLSLTLLLLLTELLVV